MRLFVFFASLLFFTPLSTSFALDEQSSLSGPQLEKLYASIEQAYRNQGKFREDFDPVDAPFDTDILAKNFTYVALRSEGHQIDDDTLIEEKPAPLIRWETPIHLWTFGTTADDHKHLDTLSTRISALTGLSVTRTRDVQLANVYILVADQDERRDMDGLIATLGHDHGGPLGNAWPEQAKFPCIARVAIDPISLTLKWAIILIKDELNGAFRRSCLTEELVQSLGLFNDGVEIRPSIFNDDAEFIELTRHDEYLLKILYDRRLRPGMFQKDVEPIVREIATKLLANAETY